MHHSTFHVFARPAVLAALAFALLVPAEPASAGVDRGRTDFVSEPTVIRAGYNSRNIARGISEDGSYALYESNTPYFVADLYDANAYGSDVFVRDMVTGENLVVSLATEGYQTGNAGSWQSVMSSDARYVAFTSQATDLDPRAADPDGSPDVYLHDLETGDTRLVSRVAGSEQAAGNSSEPRITPDGRYVLFVSRSKVYRYDRLADSTALVSATTAGTDEVDGASGSATISDDGRFVAFSSSASNLVTGDSDGQPNVFLRDMTSGTTTLVSHAAGSSTPIPAADPILTADGSTVLFRSYDARPLTGTADDNGSWDLFVWDRATDTTVLRNISSDGSKTANGGAYSPSASADGSVIAYTSLATDIVDGVPDVNNPPPGTVPGLDYIYTDLFVWVDDGTGGTTDVLTRTADGSTTANRGAEKPIVTTDGSKVVFDSTATDLVEGLDDVNGHGHDLFSADLDNGEMRVVSVDDSQEFATSWLTPGDAYVTADGGFVAFTNYTGSDWTWAVRRAMEPPLPPPPPLPETPEQPDFSNPPPYPGSPSPSPSPPPTPTPSRPPSRPRSGYWMLSAKGTVYPFGDVLSYRGAAPADAVDIEPIPSGSGYWVVDKLGYVFTYGGAGYAGGVNGNGLAPGETVVSMSATSWSSYWLFTSRGRAFAFGDARHFGDLTGVPLNGPVLDSIATPDGTGYYMVASDGGIFAFGSARFWGSMGGHRLNAPVQSLVPDGDGQGYWLVASDGGVFAFQAPFRGSMGSARLNKPVTGMVPFGNGYLMVGEDGGIFNFSDKPFHGSLGSTPPPSPIVAVAAFDG